MLNIPEDIKDLFRSDNINKPTQKKFKLSFYNEKIEPLYPYETLFPDENLFPSEHGDPWLEIENDRIESESLTITESLSETEELEFGSCESVMVEIVVADVIENLIGKEFELSVEIGGYKMPLGIFTVDSFVRQADRRKRKIIAYDRMRWFDVDVSNWYNDLIFPMTLKTFRDSLCNYVGIKQIQDSLLFDSLEISKTIESQQISGIDVLKSVCQLNGCFGHVNKLGELDYIKLPMTALYPSEDLFPSEDLYPMELESYGQSVENISTYKDLLYEDYIVEGITGLSIRQEEGDIGANVGTEDNSYAIEGNFLVYGKSALDLLNIAQSLLPQIEGRIYKPATLDCNAMPWVEVGDPIRIITRDDIVETIIMKRITSGCQAMRDQIESTGSEHREEVFGINKQILQLEGKSAVIIKNVEEVSVRVTDLKKQEEAHFKITSDAITAEVTRAIGEEEKLSGRITVEADRITAEVTRASKAEGDLSGRITVEADRITAEVTRASKAEGDLSGRITVEADRITQEVSDRKTGEHNLSSKIEQTASSITLSISQNYVGNGQISSKLSLEPDKVTFKSNRLIVDSKNFKLNGDGDATFSGTVQSAAIKTSNISGGSININNTFKVDADGNTSITGNKLSWSSTNSSMTADGTLTCKNLNAISGKFAGDLDAAGGTFNGDFSVTGFSEDKYPIKLKNSMDAYFGIGGTGFLLAKSGYYIKLDYAVDQSMPRLYGGIYTSIDNDSFSLGGVDNNCYLDADGCFKSIWTRRHKTEDVANVHISSTGYFYRVSSSSRRYKEDESVDLRGINPKGLYETPIKTYKYKEGYLAKGDPGEGKYILGMIVEDLEKTFPEAVSYEDGKPETWKERIMIPAMLKLIQEQNERLKKLEGIV